MHMVHQFVDTRYSHLKHQRRKTSAFPTSLLLGTALVAVTCLTVAALDIGGFQYPKPVPSY